MKFLCALLLVCDSLIVYAQPHNSSVTQFEVDSLLKTIYKNDEPGASIVVVQKGIPVLKLNYGVANTETKRKIDSKTNFNIGSLTKQFTAAALLQLTERKKLSLNDKIAKFFPELDKTIAGSITIQQLLTHSSGIIDHYGYSDKNLKHAHDTDVYEAIKKVDSTYFSPGTNYRYSNTGYCLLALVIERVSGLSYGGYMEKNIFRPLKMARTTIWNETQRIADEATGYQYDSASSTFKISGPDESVFFSTEGDGGIYTSIDDYLKWFDALQSGKLLTAATIKAARSAHFPVNKEKNLSYGYGWFVDESAFPHEVYHSGSNGGFRTFTFSIPEENSLIVIFSNRTGIDLEQLVLGINKILRPGK